MAPTLPATFLNSNELIIPLLSPVWETLMSTSDHFQVWNFFLLYFCTVLQPWRTFTIAINKIFDLANFTFIPLNPLNQ